MQRRCIQAFYQWRCHNVRTFYISFSLWSSSLVSAPSYFLAPQTVRTGNAAKPQRRHSFHIAIGGQAFAIKLRPTKERTPTSMLLYVLQIIFVTFTNGKVSEPPFTINGSAADPSLPPRWRQIKYVAHASKHCPLPYQCSIQACLRSVIHRSSPTAFTFLTHLI